MTGTNRLWGWRSRRRHKADVTGNPPEMPSRGTGDPLPPGTPDRTLWRRSRGIDANPTETERLLDLAGFVDGRLDDDERERVAPLIAADPPAAADAVAARVLIGATLPAASDAIVAHAVALIDPAETRGEILPLPRQPPPPQPRASPVAARCGGLPASTA